MSLEPNRSMLRSSPGLLLCGVVLLASCATVPTSKPPPPADGNDAEAARLHSPMRDVSLYSGEIPAVLARATETPYARPAPLNCATLSNQIAELDAVLGLDIDSEAGKDEANDTALRLLASGITGTIPYFGWIRRLSGAERRERRLLAAVTAGNVRRAYLKGLGDAEGCLPPASPARPDPAGVVLKSGSRMP